MIWQRSLNLLLGIVSNKRNSEVQSKRLKRMDYAILGHYAANNHILQCAQKSHEVSLLFDVQLGSMNADVACLTFLKE